MILRCLACISVLLLGACASMISGSEEEITLKTPGTDQAECMMNNGILNYRVFSNQTVKIQKNNEDLKISCKAPGNRERNLLVRWRLSPWLIADVTTGVVPGAAYDHFAGAAYGYPNVITVDFSKLPARDYPMPEYQRVGLPDPAYQGIEYYGPSMPSQESDKYGTKPMLRKKNVSEALNSSNPFYSDPANQ